MKNHARLSIAIALLLGSFSVGQGNTALACSPVAGPIPPTTPQQFFDRSAYVFSGKVLSIEKDYKTRTGGSSIHNTISTFEVSKYWKGDAGEYIQVATINNPAGCQSPYPFVVGEEYLVYASHDSFNDVLVTGLDAFGGQGTQPLKDADAHLAALEQIFILTPAPAVQDFSELVALFEPEHFFVNVKDIHTNSSLAGATVTFFSGNNQKLNQQTTDIFGEIKYAESIRGEIQEVLIEADGYISVRMARSEFKDGSLRVSLTLVNPPPPPDRTLEEKSSVTFELTPIPPSEPVSFWKRLVTFLFGWLS